MGRQSTGMRVVRARFPGKVGGHKKRGGKKLLDRHCSLCFQVKDSPMAKRCINVFCPIRTEEPTWEMDNLQSAVKLKKEDQ